MNQMHLPWLEIAVLLPLLGALGVAFVRNPEAARRYSLVVTGVTLLAAIGAWQDFRLLHTFEAHDRWDVFQGLIHRDALVVDELSAPLLPLAALLNFVAILTTLRTKVRRYSFASSLFSESVLLAIFACRSAWGVVALLALHVVPVSLELRRRGQSTRLFAIHMVPFICLLIAGQALLSVFPHAESGAGLLGVLLLAAAVLIRSGIVPAHCWVTDVFDRASFGTAILFVVPMVDAYAAMRLLFPVAPVGVLHAVSILSLVTALYAAGMAFVQTDPRRFFAYLFLSHSSLVLIGLDLATPLGLTGALCVWISVGLSLSGFGFTLRSIESRTGRLSLAEFHGMYERLPMLAAFFLLTGLASIGFPGTTGFVGAELLVEGAVRVYPIAGVLVVIVAALNGLAVLHAYFRIFTGTHPLASIDIQARLPEKIGILVLTLLILGGGIFPQPGVSSRYHAARELTRLRSQENSAPAPAHVQMPRPEPAHLTSAGTH